MKIEDLRAKIATMADDEEIKLLDEAGAEFFAALERGSICPCCWRYGELRCEPMHRGIAKVLQLQYIHKGTNWTHTPSLMKELGYDLREGAKLAYWGLMEEEQTRRPDGGRAGWWRVTEPAGVLFVTNQSSMPRHAFSYNGSRWLGGPQITIADALGTDFDLRQVLARYRPSIDGLS